MRLRLFRARLSVNTEWVGHELIHKLVRKETFTFNPPSVIEIASNGCELYCEINSGERLQIVKFIGGQHWRQDILQ